MSSATQERVATPPKAGRFYLPELDFLRFLAFFAIFLFHLPEPFVLKFFDRPGALGDVGRAGAFGVDLFFTLSGYLITRLLMREREESGDINLRAFYARTTAPQLIGNVFAPMKPSAYVFFAIFLFNFNFYQSLLTYPLPLMGLLWSISVEEQFYLFWPWFVRYLPRGRLFVVPIVMIAVACITRASLTWDLSRLLWNYTFARLDPIAVGILIALMPALKPGRALRLSLVAVGIASWLFASGWCGLPYELGRVDIAIGYPAIALGSGAFVLATLGTKSFNPGSALARRLIYLGKISYGLYVYNSIAYSTAALLVYRALAPESARTWKTLSLYVPLAFALNVAFAAASYRLLEAPFLRLKERFTRVPSRAV
jgi:peptidoglycan/LPS O-acetylase OafA/YrhL